MLIDLSRTIPRNSPTESSSALNRSHFHLGRQPILRRSEQGCQIARRNRPKLTAAGIPHGRQMGVINSGDLPQDFYGLIEAKKADDVFFVRSGQNGMFFKVKGEEARPVEGEAAANLARQFMSADAVKAEPGIANFSANLEAKYEGEYAKIMQPGGDNKSN